MPAVVALAGVDLDIAPGETVTLVGPSGSGKSTLIALPRRGDRGGAPSRRWDDRAVGDDEVFRARLDALDELIP